MQMNQKELKQYLYDLIDKKYLTDDYYYDEQEAVNFYKFISKLQLPEAPNGTKIKLLDFQLKIAIETLAIKRKSDDTRRSREVFVTMPRKTAKTVIVMRTMLYLVLTEKQEGQDNITVNNRIHQAEYAFRMLSTMIKSS